MPALSIAMKFEVENSSTVDCDEAHNRYQSVSHTMMHMDI